MPVVRRSQEGLSKLSRFVGEDLSEFDGIITHSEQTISSAAGVADRPLLRGRE